MREKKIHYCWFGGGEKSDFILRCIKSWEKWCPDYEIIEWNEGNFDVNKNIFTREAYLNKKWAFVSDYVRLHVLKNVGGIYLDTDIELTNSLDRFLKYDFFIGKESETLVSTALIGSKTNNEIVEACLSYYSERNFVINDKKLDLTPNTKIISEILEDKYKVDIKDDRIKISEKEVIFDEGYFCRKNENSPNYAIHHFEGSWISKEEVKKQMLLYKNQYNILNKILELNYDESEQKSLKKYLLEKKICIYGFGSVGKALEQLFIKSEIVRYAIYDKKIQSENRKFMNNIKDINNKFDLIIITPWNNFAAIKNELSSDKCINICDFLNIKIDRF